MEKHYLKKACERCEEGNFDHCNCYMQCPVYSLYILACKKKQVIINRNEWETPPTPKPEMI